MSVFKLAHLSDPHLAPLPKPSFRELLGKRALGYINWTRNRHLFHRRDVVDALVSDIKAQAPDHIAVTGDLVNIALPAEFAAARAWLESVGKPNNVTLIPGNHDAYVKSTQPRIAADWGAYISGDASPAGTFPFVRRRGPIALIGLSSAVPTPPLMATGTLGREQLNALDQILAQLAGEQLFRVLLIHHPLESAARMKWLTDADDLLELLRRRNVELVLHGHDHIHSTMWFDGPRGQFPAIGVPSASSVAHKHYPGAAYNLFTIERDGDGWLCQQTVRGFKDGHTTIEDLKTTRLI